MLEAFVRKKQPPVTEADTAGPWFIERREQGRVVYAHSAEAALAAWELALLGTAAFPASGSRLRGSGAKSSSAP